MLSSTRWAFSVFWQRCGEALAELRDSLRWSIRSDLRYWWKYRIRGEELPRYDSYEIPHFVAGLYGVTLQHMVGSRQAFIWEQGDEIKVSLLDEAPE